MQLREEGIQLTYTSSDEHVLDGRPLQTLVAIGACQQSLGHRRRKAVRTQNGGEKALALYLYSNDAVR